MNDVPEACLVTVFKSTRKTGTYIYVPRETGIAAVPDGLLEAFGQPEEVISLKLSADRMLANAETKAVLTALQRQGYYLQLPPEPRGGVA